MRARATSLSVRSLLLVMVATTMRCSGDVTPIETPEDPCLEQDCSGHGQCAVVGVDTAICVCDPGYYADGLVCAEIVVGEECHGVGCSGHGTCVVVQGDPDYPVCVCNEGFYLVGNTSCVEGQGLTCGAGTHEEDGVCVPDGANENWTDPEIVMPCVDSLNVPHASLALDSADVPHVIYTNDPLLTGYIHYTFWTGTEWDTTVIDEGPESTVDIALDSLDNVHVVYCAAGILKYAQYDGVAWETTDLDANDHIVMPKLALDSSDDPHILYSIPSTGAINHANWNGASWDITSVSDDGTWWYCHGGIALDSSDGVHIACSNLLVARYGRLTVSGWQFEEWGTSSDKKAAYGLAIDSAGNPSFVLVSRGDMGVPAVATYMQWTANAWDSMDIFSTHLSERLSAQMAFDSSTAPHVAIGIYDGVGMRYAHFTGSEWDIEVHEPTKNANQRGLKIDSLDRVHLLYLTTSESGEKCLKYVRQIN